MTTVWVFVVPPPHADSNVNEADKKARDSTRRVGVTPIRLTRTPTQAQQWESIAMFNTSTRRRTGGCERRKVRQCYNRIGFNICSDFPVSTLCGVHCGNNTPPTVSMRGAIPDSALDCDTTKELYSIRCIVCRR